MSLPKVGLYFAGMIAPIVLIGATLMVGTTWSLLSTDGESRKYVSANIGAVRGNTWKALDEYEPGGRSIRIAVVGNSHAKDMFNAMQLSGFANIVDLVPLISNRQCRLSRKDRLLQLVLPMSASDDDVKRCRSQYLYVDEFVESLDGIILAPLWGQAQLDELPRFLDRMRMRGMPVLVAGNTA